jgi:hypothetical protein
VLDPGAQSADALDLRLALTQASVERCGSTADVQEIAAPAAELAKLSAGFVAVPIPLIGPSVQDPDRTDGRVTQGQKLKTKIRTSRLVPLWPFAYEATLRRT